MELPSDIKNVLFVCTGNSCRSVMAEGILKKMVSEHHLPLEVYSAGVSAISGMGATDDTVHAMQKIGIDVSRHKSKRIQPILIDKADLIIVMQARHRDAILDIIPSAGEKIFLLTQFGSTQDENAEKGIPDPIGLGEEYYHHIGQVIFKHLQFLLKEFRVS